MIPLLGQPFDGLQRPGQLWRQRHQLAMSRPAASYSSSSSCLTGGRICSGFCAPARFGLTYGPSKCRPISSCASGPRLHRLTHDRGHLQQLLVGRGDGRRQKRRRTVPRVGACHRTQRFNVRVHRVRATAPVDVDVDESGANPAAAGIDFHNVIAVSALPPDPVAFSCAAHSSAAPAKTIRPSSMTTTASATSPSGVRTFRCVRSCGSRLWPTFCLFDFQSRCYDPSTICYDVQSARIADDDRLDAAVAEKVASGRGCNRPA